jgi:hypothetical protein
MKKEIQDKKIIELLKDKEKLAQDNLKIIKDMEELEKQFNKNAGKVKRIDEKVRPKILDIVSKSVLGEYEELSRVFNDNGTWKMEFVDRLEEFKKMFNNRGKEK